MLTRLKYFSILQEPRREHFYQKFWSRGNIPNGWGVFQEGAPDLQTQRNFIENKKYLI